MKMLWGGGSSISFKSACGAWCEARSRFSKIIILWGEVGFDLLHFIMPRTLAWSLLSSPSLKLWPLSRKIWVSRWIPFSISSVVVFWSFDASSIARFMFLLCPERMILWGNVLCFSQVVILFGSIFF